MREIDHKIEGNYQIEQDTILRGMDTKDLTTASGIHLDLQGMVSGNLIAKTGSSVNIYGTVVGTVINEGADITIYGNVGSINNTREGAQTQVAPGAVVIQ